MSLPSLPHCDLAVGASRITGIHERLVLRVLAALPRGRLLLTLPDGSERQFGDPQGRSWQVGAAAPAALALDDTAEIRVSQAAFFRRCVLFGDLGFAESYLNHEWNSPNLPAVIAWFIANVDHLSLLSGSRGRAFGLNLLRSVNRWGHRLRPNSRRRASDNVSEHYDLSNDFFALWLDPAMMYSGAKWQQPGETLEDAQRNKNEELCRKLRLRPQDHVLEIGTGWGGWSLHAARHHGCRVTTLTLSREQAELARRRVSEAGLAGRVEVRVQDYRELPADERYDKLVSIEMLEAVGFRYLEQWCAVASRALKRDGLLALQFITCPDARYDEMRRGVDFIQKHVFPGSLLVSTNRLNRLLARHGGFELHHLEDWGQDYARTLAAWRAAFLASLPQVRSLGFSERFIRKWNYYLAYCEAAFALRNISVVQTVHTRPNNLSFA